MFRSEKLDDNSGGEDEAMSKDKHEEEEEEVRESQTPDNKGNRIAAISDGHIEIDETGFSILVSSGYKPGSLEFDFVLESLQHILDRNLAQKPFKWICFGALQHG